MHDQVGEPCHTDHSNILFIGLSISSFDLLQFISYTSSMTSSQEVLETKSIFSWIWRLYLSFSSLFLHKYIEKFFRGYIQVIKSLLWNMYLYIPEFSKITDSAYKYRHFSGFLGQYLVLLLATSVMPTIIFIT